MQLGRCVQVTTVYSIHQVARLKAGQLEIRNRLDGLVQSISAEDLLEEVRRVRKEPISDDISAWLIGLKMECPASKYSIRVAMVAIRISARSTKIATLLMRAHQRLMLERAHHKDIDIAVS